MNQLDALDPGWLRGKPGVKWSLCPDDVLPAWIADMDFPAPPPVRDALRAAIDVGDLGYPGWLMTGATPLREAFAARMAELYGWRPEPDAVREVTDLINGVELSLHLGTREGDAVAMHTPSYPPFLAAVRRMRRELVPIPMERDGDGWGFDVERMRRDIAARRCTVLVLVNPHNPTGRVLTRGELDAVARVAVDHDLLVVSDEIHAELAYPPHQHIPFASLGPDVAARTITLSSATKAFNLAGIHCAVAHVGAGRLRAAIEAAPEHLYGEVSSLSVAATLAAWRHGGPWLEAVRAHLDRNRRLVDETLRIRLPRAVHLPPQATYLSWIDCGALELDRPPAEVVLDKARVMLDDGRRFGPGGEGYVRLNFATSREVLTEILDRMAGALAEG